MDGARRFGSCIARDAAGKRKLPEQAAHTSLILGNIRIEFAISALQPTIGNHTWGAMTGAGDKEPIEVALFDNPV
jgi:hypothetical protein